MPLQRHITVAKPCVNGAVLLICKLVAAVISQVNVWASMATLLAFNPAFQGQEPGQLLLRVNKRMPIPSLLLPGTMCWRVECDTAMLGRWR